MIPLRLNGHATFFHATLKNRLRGKTTLDSNPSSVTYQLSDVSHTVKLLCTSFYPHVPWRSNTLQFYKTHKLKKHDKLTMPGIEQ